MRGFPLFLLLLPAFLATAARAANNDILLRGDKAYAQNNWDSAALYYNNAAIGGDALALYKLGNAQYRLRHTGSAVLAWIRALKVQPGFTPASRNICTVQEGLRFGKNGKNDAALVAFWHSITKPAASNQWAVMSLLIFCLMAGTFAWRRFQHKPAPRVSYIAGALLLGIAFAAMAFYAVYADAPGAVAVVMRPNAVMQSDAKGGNTLNLPEGLIVKVNKEEKNMVQIILPDGRSGIVQSVDIATVR